MTTDDDRAAYLEGEDSSVLDAEERRSLDAVRGVLADPSVWHEPAAGLEAEIVAAITTADDSEAPRARPERALVDRWKLCAIVVAVVVVSVIAAIAFRSF